MKAHYRSQFKIAERAAMFHNALDRLQQFSHSSCENQNGPLANKIQVPMAEKGEPRQLRRE